jgi:hypothetical protein
VFCSNLRVFRSNLFSFVGMRLQFGQPTVCAKDGQERRPLKQTTSAVITSELNLSMVAGWKMGPSGVI